MKNSKLLKLVSMMLIIFTVMTSINISKVYALKPLPSGSENWTQDQIDFWVNMDNLYHFTALSDNHRDDYYNFVEQEFNKKTPKEPVKEFIDSILITSKLELIEANITNAFYYFQVLYPAGYKTYVVKGPEVSRTPQYKPIYAYYVYVILNGQSILLYNSSSGVTDVYSLLLMLGDLKKTTIENQKTVENLTNTITEITRQLEAEKQKTNADQEKISALEKQVISLTVEKETLQKEIQSKNIEIQNLLQKIEQMSKEIIEKDQKIKDQSEEISKLKAELEKTNQKIKDLEELIKQKDIQISKLEEVVSKLQKEREEYIKIINELNNKIEQMDKDAKAEREKYEKMIEEYKNKVSQMEKDARAEREKYEKIIQQMEKEFKTEREKYIKIIDENNAKIEVLDKENQKSQDKIKQLELENQALKNEKDQILAEKEQIIKELNEKIQGQEEKILTLEDRLNRYALFMIDKNYYKEINDENESLINMDAKAFIKNDRTMLPLRYLAYSLDFNVDYDAEKKEAVFTNANNPYLEKKKVTLNILTGEMFDEEGNRYVSDSKPLIINDRVHASINNVSKIFSASQGRKTERPSHTIEWEPENREVYVYKYIK